MRPSNSVSWAVTQNWVGYCTHTHINTHNWLCQHSSRGYGILFRVCGPPYLSLSSSPCISLVPSKARLEVYPGRLHYLSSLSFLWTSRTSCAALRELGWMTFDLCFPVFFSLGCGEEGGGRREEGGGRREEGGGRREEGGGRREEGGGRREEGGGRREERFKVMCTTFHTLRWSYIQSYSPFLISCSSVSVWERDSTSTRGTSKFHSLNAVTQN